MRVKVLEEDIRSGSKGSATGCPIAHAIRRESGRKEVRVAQVNVRLGKRRFVCLPPEAQTFIREFDAGRMVRPMEFDL